MDLTFQAVAAGISAGAEHRDRHPAFPEQPFQQLALSGLLAIPVPDPVGAQERRTSFAEEWRVLLAVARADGSVGRRLDGPFNGVERVAILAPEPLRWAELAAVAAGELRVGAWGANPIPGEGTRLASSVAEARYLASRPSVLTLPGSIALSFWWAEAPRDRPSPPK